MEIFYDSHFESASYEKWRIFLGCLRSLGMTGMAGKSSDSQMEINKKLFNKTLRELFYNPLENQ
ncbi:hypothetical protein THEYE_A1459 [Thermodesulfovibrio yellowstonii DSM 11347]|uniref:Uncharacterized protein n=1 Tax=Thermodesulfovibrio yellowstonii (strain ATCC 51303 / DSM 11347 / YP87) TaxID=289376 RepID=B5YG59_THEYD|nr:hypothetical protein THEYE_A1459 [Thermodesulfovibrio yellowstonii DSM 11347]